MIWKLASKPAGWFEEGRWASGGGATEVKDAQGWWREPEEGKPKDGVTEWTLFSNLEGMDNWSNGWVDCFSSGQGRGERGAQGSGEWIPTIGICLNIPKEGAKQAGEAVGKRHLIVIKENPLLNLWLS